MGFLDRFKNIFRRIESKSSLTYFGMQPVYPDADVDSFIKDAYSGNASVFSIVNLAARKFSFIPRNVMKNEDETEAQKSAIKKLKTLLPDGPFRKSRIQSKAYTRQDTKGKAKDLDALLKRPNPMQGQDAFFFSVYAYYKITGEAFVWLNRGEVELNNDSIDLPVLEMWVLPSNLMEIVPTKEDVWGVAKYQIQLDSKMVDIRKEDIIHWKSFNPNFDTFTRDHQRGLPPLKAGAKILTQDEDSTDAAVAMYQNGGARGVLFEKSLKNISPTQVAAIQDITAKRINNKDMKSAVASIQGDWGYLDIGKDSVDLQLLDGNDKAFAKLCHVMGVPPGLFLIDQTYENMRSNRKRLIAELIIPDCTSFNDEMNRMLLPAFGLKSDSIQPDYSELPEMQEDMKDMIDYLDKSPITKNEFRDALGYEELNIEGMDKIYIEGGKRPIDEELNIESPDL